MPATRALLIFCLYLFGDVMRRRAVFAGHCYSCAGICHSEQCNCQVGSCESDFCFIERKATELRGVYRITKGCVRRPLRTRLGCDFDHFADHLHCLCIGDFCNDSIQLRVLPRRNVTCRECPERQPDCGKTCRGEWCHEKATTGAAGCGYGPPSLPYFYQGPELLATRSKVCIAVSRGNGMPHRYCVCNTDMCNDHGTHAPHALAYFTPLLTHQQQQQQQHHRSRSVHSSSPPYSTYTNGGAYQSSVPPKLSECVSCDLTASTGGVAMTSNCKQNRCHGHYCTYATQRLFFSGSATGAMGGGSFDVSRGSSISADGHSSSLQQAMVHERQGCLNTTDGSQIQLGCFHKWMNNEAEELYCACRGDGCNRDLATITVSSSSSGRESAFTLLLCLISLLMDLLILPYPR